MKSDGSIFTLENEELLITVESHGAQLSRIYDKKADREILWSADPAVWNRHSPILFPFIGKSVDGKYRYEGKEYNISSHGFARDMDFEPVLCDMDECTYVLKDTPETMEKYPFHFELEITHRLKGRTIETSWKVTNLNGKEMLFMIGGHPAFQVPEGKTIYDYTLVFNKEGVNVGQYQDSLHYQAPDADGYEESALQGDLKLTDGKVPVTPGFFDTALTYMFDKGQVSSVGLLTDGKPYVTLICDGFPFVGVWTMEKTHPFVCLEPWYGVCDSKDFTGELKDRQGVQSLNAWETWEKGYSIRIE